ncbi:hypothetical protein CVT26_012655 [Gymnopilus dilepis]|uniref:DUF6533 domain-containing protein n=1 Tax=Gymnopilus dilepis TaxID=231916 RepID=A0A409YPY1_9AGAR|nr:hypothetical protein CVT26_012655 [Gymnopilus dilepis]
MVAQSSLEWLYADRAIALLSLGTATCVLYDHITTLDEEIELIWRKFQWSKVHMLFFVSRYVGDAMQIFGAATSVGLYATNTSKVGLSFSLHSIFSQLSRSKANLVVLACLGSVAMAATQSIMIYRISGLYGNQPWAVWLPFLTFAAQWIAVVAIFSLSLASKVSVRRYRAVKGIKWSRLPLDSARGHSPASFTDIHFRDSMIYLTVSSGMCIGNIVIMTRTAVLTPRLPLCVGFFTPCIIGSRLILNLRENYYKPFSEDNE